MNPNYDKISLAISDMKDQLVAKKEQWLLDRLKDKGFEFAEQPELIRFLKTRCRLDTHANKLNQFYADNILIAEWWDTVEITMEGNTCTAVYGNQPKNLPDKV